MCLLKTCHFVDILVIIIAFSYSVLTFEFTTFEDLKGNVESQKLLGAQLSLY